MWSEKYANPLQIELKPSKIALGVTLIVHLGAVVALLLSSISIAIKSLGMLLIVSSTLYSLSRIGWTRHFKLSLRWVPIFKSVCWRDEFWYLRVDNGTEYIAQLLPSSYVSRWLVVVNLRVTDLPWHSRNVSLLFLPDNIDKELFRRLRIRLRWYPEVFRDNSVELK